MVQDELEGYATAPSKTEKTYIVSRCVHKIRQWSKNRLGFVKQDPKTGRWTAPRDSVARITVAQAFRDALGDKYHSSKDNKQKKRIIAKGYYSSNEEEETSLEDYYSPSMMNHNGNGRGTRYQPNPSMQDLVLGNLRNYSMGATYPVSDATTSVAGATTNPNGYGMNSLNQQQQMGMHMMVGNMSMMVGNMNMMGGNMSMGNMNMMGGNINMCNMNMGTLGMLPQTPTMPEYPCSSCCHTNNGNASFQQQYPPPALAATVTPSSSFVGAPGVVGGDLWDVNTEDAFGSFDPLPLDQIDAFAASEQTSALFLQQGGALQ